MSRDQKNKLSQSVNNAIKMVGDEHILCIIGTLSDGSMRFNEIQRAIEGINPTTLTDRLKKLEHEGIVMRKEETVDKLSVVYELTEKGKAILPIVNEFANFASKFLK
ncbi:MAG: helix-turn-helix transcriptional regulator [Candidatus Levybacteria bacterium]|nr:helix-turn-helix transcriptional regulator [Candidatus Levybacteria bacterium]